MIAKITMSFDRLSDANLLTKARDIFTAMTGNPSFAAPTPALDDLYAAILDFQAAVNAAAGRERTKVVLKNRSRVALIAILKAIGNYVTFTANGDSAMLSSSGYDPRKTPQPVIVSKPTVTVDDGTNSGELLNSADSAKNTRGFVHQYTADPLTDNSVWNSFTTTSKKYTFTGLNRAKVYWCRVGVIGAKGQLVFSDPISRVVQ